MADFVSIRVFMNFAKGGRIQLVILRHLSCWAVELVAFSFTASSFQRWEISDVLHPRDGTHLEDPKTLCQFQPPAGDRFFVAVFVKPSGECISPVPLGYFPLDI